MKSKYKKMDYDQLISVVHDKDTYHECIDEDELIDIICDRLAYGYYKQAQELIDVLREQHDPLSHISNYWKNDCGNIIPLLDEEDILDNFNYLLD